FGGGGFGGRGGFSLEMMGGGRGQFEIAQFEQFAWDGTTRYLLFRYFDTKVEPGKRYRYRVRLVLADVNADVQELYLDNDVIERRAENSARFRFTDWSEPSSVASVPPEGLVYVAGAEPASAANFAAESEANLLIKSLDAEQTAEVELARTFTRGAVLNLFRQLPQIIRSATFQPVDRNGEPQDSPKFTFRTGLTLLDFDGGEELNGKRDMRAPARALLMDANGRMTIATELSAHDQVWQHGQLMKAKEDAQRRQREQRDAGGGRPGRGGGGRGP
ncbi:MAG TPA: hypothetical protein PKC18_09625, partial [Lacipirellulaceae bacterium]|nr:hypothetical protein [Lacipirellulaceae bacterium]